MRIAIIGTGYVGLVTGLCLADKGHSIICVETNKSIVQRLNRSELTIYESGLDVLLDKAIRYGNFSVTTLIEEALDGVDLALVCVGTPTLNGRIDLSQLVSCIKQIGNWIANSNSFLSIVIKSTVLPKTTDTVVKNILENQSGKRLGEFGLGMNPEFLREGSAVTDFMQPDRVVIGFEDQATKERLTDLYAPWQTEKIFVSTRTAELIKYASNMVLATQISMVNELANLAYNIGQIDISEVLHGVTTDKRWNPILENSERVNPQILSYLIPGSGFGGSCFPKDIQALRSMGDEIGVNMRILKSVIEINDCQPSIVIDILKSKVNLRNKKIMILGLAFKPGTDDVRESASFKIIQKLLNEEAIVFAHDPVAIESFKISYPELSSVKYLDNWKESVSSVEVIIIATNWEEYLSLNTHSLDNIYIFDTRRFLNKDNFINYMSIGLS